MAIYFPRDLVLCTSPDGWSLHAPGSTDEDIASGAAPWIMTRLGKVSRDDRALAFALWQDGQKLKALLGEEVND